MTRTREGATREHDRSLGVLLDLVDLRKADLLALQRADSGVSDGRARLGDWLYENWYTATRDRTADSAPPRRAGNMVPLLRTAIEPVCVWEPGWVVLQPRKDGGCVAG